MISSILVTLIMEALLSSETSIFTISTWRYITEDGILHSHRREKLKPYIQQDIVYSEKFRELQCRLSAFLFHLPGEWIF
jgi:hypothetical protein